mmetsp:Transcript_28548/g.68708  ORF Transcript_28548/g.68708 Transcript_28548/m.68708 type:complete len:203 (+) Transcript_28548:11-619(+)
MYVPSTSQIKFTAVRVKSKHNRTTCLASRQAIPSSAIHLLTIIRRVAVIRIFITAGTGTSIATTTGAFRPGTFFFFIILPIHHRTTRTGYRGHHQRSVSPLQYARDITPRSLGSLQYPRREQHPIYERCEFVVRVFRTCQRQLSRGNAIFVISTTMVVSPVPSVVIVVFTNITTTLILLLVIRRSIDPTDQLTQSPIPKFLP